MGTSIKSRIYGHDKIKEALVLQLAGGCRKIRPDGVITRGDMHMLLIGDPGSGKCVSGNTKIMLENGEIVSIKSFNENYSSLNYNSNKELITNCSYIKSKNICNFFIKHGLKVNEITILKKILNKNL